MDGECDDGGEGASYTECSFGTDCGDCGTRNDPDYAVKCDDTCKWPNDGECDDGGTGSTYNSCSVGTDCGDCGSRIQNGATDSTTVSLLQVSQKTVVSLKSSERTAVGLIAGTALAFVAVAYSTTKRRRGYSALPERAPA